MASAARTATFLMTDIEGSTRLWEEQRAAMAVALEAHDALLRAAVEQAGGTVVKTTGDGLLAAFDRPEAGLTAAVEAQHALERQVWPATGPLRVRMAIHSGSAEVRDGDFFGPALNRVARLMAIGHGGQVLVSGSTSALAADSLPPGCELIDLGEHRLRDLDRPEHIYQLAAEGLRREFPPLRSGITATNLPAEITSFIGRERETAEIRGLLDQHRLVSLVGVGGTGKTRLMLHLAAEATSRHPDGAWLVELAPLREPGLVGDAAVRALGVQLAPSQPVIDALTAFLRDKDLLLLLDNCEHLVEAVADVVERLLGTCPSLRVLTTTREALGLPGEATYPVPPLAMPGELDVRDLDAVAASEAVRLFVERATTTLPTFRLDQGSAASVVEICRRLDGIPLALELAAARVNVLSPDEIAHGLDDRFRLLTGGRRTAVPRQQTLRALIDWSWDLLEETDQRLLRRLSVFAGGWTLEAAAAVTGGQADAGSSAAAISRIDTLDALGRLADRSLVVATHDAATRYGMLETIREYARDRLEAGGEAVELRTRHLAHFRRLAIEAEPGLEGPDMLASLDRLDAEIDNLRAALDWAFRTDPQAALEMAVGLSVYWNVRLIGSEGRDRMVQAVDLARSWRSAGGTPSMAARSALAARVLSHAAQIQASYTGRPADAALGEEAAVMAREADDAAVLADTLATLAFARVAVDGSVPPEGPDREDAIRALELAEQHGDWYRASIIEAAFAITVSTVDPASAEAWLDRATAAARRTRNLFALANLTGVRGRVASLAGRLTEAERWLIEARAEYRALRDQRFDRVLSSELAHVLRRAGRLDEAETEYRTTIRGWLQSGNPGAVANQLECFALIALARGQGARTARLLAAAEAMREAAEAPMTAFEREEYGVAVGQLREELDEGAFGSAWAEGRRMTADEAVAYALSP